MSMQYENGQAHARQALDEAFERQNASANGTTHIDENSSFCATPGDYMWKCIGKQEMLVPYRFTSEDPGTKQHAKHPGFPNSGAIRWENHIVWIVEGTLRIGESNIMEVRRFYIEADSWLILLGEGLDRTGALTKSYMFFKSTDAGNIRRGQWYTL